MKVSVIIPVFNEKNTIEEIISKVKKVNLGNYEKEIVVVDDCSSDGTVEILKSIEGIKSCFHKKNYGKGRAVKSGILKSSGDIFIIQDGDLEYNPENYKQILEKFKDPKINVVYGSRLLGKKNSSGSWIFYFGGKVVTKFTNLLYGSKLTDEPTCYKAFRKKLLNLLVSANNNGFDWEPEITAKILRTGNKIYEVPIDYFPRKKKEGKKISILDGLKTLLVLLKWRFKKLGKID